MQSPRYELNKNFFFFPNSNKEDTVDNDPRAFLMGMGHHMEANVWIHKAGQRQWRNSSNWLIDDIIWGEGKKKRKGKISLLVFFLIPLDLQEREKRRWGHWTNTALAQKPHGSAGKGLLVSIHPSSSLLERKLGLNPSSNPHTACAELELCYIWSREK